MRKWIDLFETAGEGYLTEAFDLPWGHGQAGCWITDTGMVVPCDYEGDVHHGDIIAQDGGFDEMEDELDQLVDVGHSRGWVRIRMSADNFNVSMNTTVSPTALRKVPRAVDGQTEFHCDVFNAANSDYKSFYADSIGRLMGMIREYLDA
jgi:hypothetical protein